jgi:hypothetical protein
MRPRAGRPQPSEPELRSLRPSPLRPPGRTPHHDLLRSENRPHSTRKQINIKLNAASSTQSFHPTSLRLEGNDPLSIAILFDVSGDQRELLAAFQKDFSAWVPVRFVPRTTSPSTRSTATSSRPPTTCPQQCPCPPERPRPRPRPRRSLTATRPSPPAANPFGFAAPSSVVMRKLSQLPGRRILIVVTGGRDGKSQYHVAATRSEAGLDSVTVFGLTSPGPMDSEQMRDIYTLTQQSGGFLFSPQPNDLAAQSPRSIIALLAAATSCSSPCRRPDPRRPIASSSPFPNSTPTSSPQASPSPSRIRPLDHPSTDLP